jgi:predicted metal-dependent phosphoesterase TrpH
VTSIRAAVHVHTDWSFDGTWPLAQLAAALRRRGYGAMLTAEHCQSLDEESWRRYRALCAELSSSDFLVLPGVEYRDAANVVHLPTWGDLPHLGDGVDVGDLLSRVRELGGVAVWAHPGRRHAVDAFDPAWLALLGGVEVWNRKYDGWQPNHVAADLAEKHALARFATLDFHRRRQFAPLVTRIEVTGAPSEASVVDAVHAGRVRPEFLRVDVRTWLDGPPAKALSSVDASRKRVLGVLRRRR